MALPSGTRLGPYELAEQIGAGGMGEVYRATDTRLNRSVAIKVLPEQLIHSASRRERFEREARAVGSLNHAHVCALYDIGEQNGTHFLVMELVEGETLQQRLATRRLPLSQALEYGAQIAGALDVAHRHGVVHRDLKPANIMLTKSGVKLLDFGLARLTDTAGPIGPGALTATAHAPFPLTVEGAILGTPQYMAPEQLEGRDADSRSDVFALGAVLYEMVTGAKAFDARSQASLIAAIIRAEPPAMRELAAATPERVEHIVMRCLAKDPDDRWQSARDVQAELAFAARSAPAAPRTDSFRASRKAWVVAGVLGAAVVGMLAARSPYFSPSAPGPAPAATRFQIAALPTPNALNIALSPNGRHIAYVGRDASQASIWVRSLDSLDARALPGTEGLIAASYPFWSPDSRFVAFRTGRELKKADVTGGPVQTITTTAPISRRGTWSTAGTILFATDVINSVPALGGEAKAVTRLDRALGEIAHSAPWFLPDGRHFLYKTTTMDPRNRAVYVGSLEPGEPRLRLLEASKAIYVEPGFIIYARERTLYARPFDASRLEFTGEAVPIHENVLYNENLDSSAFDASNEGTLILRSVAAPAGPRAQLGWVDRSGLTAKPLPISVEQQRFRLSPDSKQVVASEGNPPDIWIVDLERDARTRLTTDPDTDHDAVWSPDGAWIAFDSHRGSKRGIYVKPANGTAAEQLRFDSGPNHVRVSDWSSDKRFIVFERDRSVGGGNDLWVLPVAGERPPFRYLGGSFNYGQGTLSPDGRWMAYATNESGTSQVVVQPFPDASQGKWQVSTKGGANPRWGHNGQELYYRDATGSIVAVPITAQPTFRVGAPRAVSTDAALEWDVASTDQRVLRMITEAGMPPVAAAGAPASSITVILNWPALVGKK